jgi:hypothetical protein
MSTLFYYQNAISVLPFTLSSFKLLNIEECSFWALILLCYNLKTLKINNDEEQIGKAKEIAELLNIVELHQGNESFWKIARVGAVVEA